jgi:hypothetical protein
MSEALAAIDERSAAGTELARVLAGAWRTACPIPIANGDAASLLLEAGAAGLVWQRFRSAKEAKGPAGRPWRQEHRRCILECGTLEDHLEEVLARMRSAGLEPIHIKGWSTARLYAEPGLRPYSDIDLCLPPALLTKAIAVLHQSDGLQGVVDLHEGVPDLPDRSWDEAYRRSRLVRLRHSEVRVLGAEDHLRLTAFHLLRHGGWCPLWLCDVAVILEALPAGFDWDYCLQGSKARRAWLLAVIGLAIRLLDTRLADPVICGQASKIPAWLVRTVLRSWGLAAATRGWDADNLNAITAKFRLGLSPAAPVPLTLVQAAAFLTRTVPSLARAVLRTVRQQDSRPFALHRGKRFLGGCFDMFSEWRLRASWQRDAVPTAGMKPAARCG